MLRHVTEYPYFYLGVTPLQGCNPIIFLCTNVHKKVTLTLLLFYLLVIVIILVMVIVLSIYLFCRRFEARQNLIIISITTITIYWYPDNTKPSTNTTILKLVPGNTIY